MLKSTRRTHTCGALRSDHVGEHVILQGWVRRTRNLGGVTFIDLRDRYGITQLTADHRSPAEARAVAAEVHPEYVLEVQGQVVERSSPNPQLATGQVEVLVQQARILSRTAPLPFALHEQARVNEDTRLRYRYLDLRRPELGGNLVTRHRAALAVRRYLDGEDFVEVETPVLTRATPEGARDFLVPSRVQPRRFFALPQSPQIFKQILMVAGMDRYFQIVKCFRDEDLRADRQPEFTQIDVEMAFADRELVLEAAEGITRAMWQDVLGHTIERFPRLTWAQAMDRYGLDAPDLRFGLEHVTLTDALRHTSFRIIRGALDQGGIAKAFRVPGAAADTSRKVLDSWASFVQRYGLGGVLWAKVAEGAGTHKWTGPLGRLDDSERAEVGRALDARPGDLLLLAAGPAPTVHAGLGRLRALVARERNLVPEGTFAFCWVTDFPAFEWDDEAHRWVAVHHPFTAPRPDHVPLLDENRESEVLSDAYDLVCNGHEIAGGSIRIHDPEVQRKVFEALGLSRERAEDKFGFLLDALRYGAPPHGGIAFGFDRCCMLLAGTENIREVIAFPKTTTAQDLMSGAPSTVDPEQLAELHVRTTDREEP